MALRAERDLAMLGSIIGLGVLAFLVGAMFAQSELLFLPFFALLAGVAVTTGATIALATGYPRNACRFLVTGGGILLAAAVVNGIPLGGVPVAVAAALVWGAVVILNAKLRRGYYDRK